MPTPIFESPGPHRSNGLRPSFSKGTILPSIRFTTQGKVRTVVSDDHLRDLPIGPTHPVAAIGRPLGAGVRNQIDHPDTESSEKGYGPRKGFQGLGSEHRVHPKRVESVEGPAQIAHHLVGAGDAVVISQTLGAVASPVVHLHAQLDPLLVEQSDGRVVEQEAAGSDLEPQRNRGGSTPVSEQLRSGENQKPNTPTGAPSGPHHPRRM